MAPFATTFQLWYQRDGCPFSSRNPTTQFLNWNYYQSGLLLHTWKAFLSHVQCVFFLDNEAAKGALIRAATSTAAGQAILSGFVSEEMDCQIKVCFSRVPTASNISDNPSRLQTDEMDALGVNRSDVAWQDLWRLLGDYGSRHRGFEAGSVDVLPIC